MSTYSRKDGMEGIGAASFHGPFRSYRSRPHSLVCWGMELRYWSL
jgi:hypothetical protein